MSHVYVAPTAASELGARGGGRGVGELRPGQVPAVVRNLVVHMDQVGSVPPDRSDEPSMLRVSDMLARLHDLDDAAITEPRPAGRRLIGRCRTSSMLATAFYRQLGVAARLRCGFAAYYGRPGFLR